jgi:hypothetical protein
VSDEGHYGFAEFFIDFGSISKSLRDPDLYAEFVAALRRGRVARSYVAALRDRLSAALAESEE